MKRTIALRRVVTAAFAAAALACADDTENAEVAADTAALAAPAGGITLADVAGVWQMDIMPADRDTVVGTHQIIASADPAAWKIKFPDRNDTISVHTVVAAGDSIIAMFGPYSSLLRPGVEVNAEVVLRRAGDALAGNITAHYDVPTADSLVHLRARGTRVP
jgi:hypothetical protein